MSKTESIETIKTLLIKGRPESGSTEAEQIGSRKMAFRLMEKNGITKEDLISSPKSQYVPPKKQHVMWYKIVVPSDAQDHKTFQKMMHILYSQPSIKFVPNKGMFCCDKAYAYKILELFELMAWQVRDKRQMEYKEAERKAKELREAAIFRNVSFSIVFTIIFVGAALLIHSSI